MGLAEKIELFTAVIAWMVLVFNLFIIGVCVVMEWGYHKDPRSEYMDLLLGKRLNTNVLKELFYCAVCTVALVIYYFF